MELTEKIVETSLYEGRSYMSKGGRKRWSQHVLWDDGLRGFGLRITSTNRKSFIVAYRVGGRKRTKTLGSVDELTLDDARDRAAELLGAADGERQRAPEQPPIEGIETVTQLADAYLEGHLKGHVPSWFADQRLIRTHIKPAIGRSKVTEVTQTDLASLRRRVGRRFPSDARRLKTLLDGMFDWAAERGLWSRSSRKAVGKARPPRGPRPAPEVAPKPVPEPAPPPSAEELLESLQHSEGQRRELEARLEEISFSGAEMLAKLNDQAAGQNDLETELAKSRRELGRAKAAAAALPDPEKTAKQLANLRQSVGQLMDSLEAAKGERQEMAEKLATAEARARAQTEKVVSLAHLRNEMEAKALEEERKAAIRKVQHGADDKRRRGTILLAAGVIGGVLLTLLLQRVLGFDEPAPTLVAASSDGSAVMTAGDGNESAEELEPIPAASPAAGATPASNDPSTAADGDEPRPDPAAAEAAVLSWATAWSEQRVDDYLAAYSGAFVPPGGLRRAEWTSQRRDRILRPASIRVTVDSLNRTVVDAGRVRVSFEQSYETKTYADRVAKTLELVWEDGSWKIAAEQVR